MKEFTVRLYSRMNAVAVDHPEYGHFEPATDDGGFDFPDDLADEQRRFHHRGKPAWETEDERAQRLHGEESARRRDPEALYSAVADIANIARQAAAQPGPSAEVAAELAELRRQLAELKNAAQEPGDTAGDGRPAKTPRSTSKAAKSAVESTGGNQ